MTNVEIGKKINELNVVRPVNAAVLMELDKFFASLTGDQKAYAASYGAGMASAELRKHFKRFN